MKTASEFAGPARTNSDTLAAIASMSIDEVRARLSEVCVLQARLDAEKIALNARMSTLVGDPETPMVVVPERELTTHGGLTSREARELVARGAVSEVAPTMVEALLEGCTTAAHLDVLGRGLRMVGDRREEFLTHISELVDAATTMKVSEFGNLVRETARSVVVDDGVSTLQRQQRETFFSMRTDEEGCLLVRGKFDPLSAAVLTSKVGRLVEAMFHSGDRDVPVEVMPWVEPNDHRQAQALIALISGSVVANACGDGVGPTVRAEVIVHIDLDSLRDGLGAETVCRTASGADLPVETVRRLACEADIIPLVLDGRSVPIDVGRAKRLATVHQRRALEAIHTTCAVPECDVRFDRCHIHHIEYWEHGGPTDIANMVPLCGEHHRAVHEGKRNIHALIGEEPS